MRLRDLNSHEFSYKGVMNILVAEMARIQEI